MRADRDGRRSLERAAPWLRAFALALAAAALLAAGWAVAELPCGTPGIQP